MHKLGASQVVLVVKNLPAKGGDLGDVGLIPRLRRSLGRRNGNPHEESQGRKSWRAAVHRITKRQTWLKRISTQALCIIYIADTYNAMLCSLWKMRLICKYWYWKTSIMYSKNWRRVFALLYLIIQQTKQDLESRSHEPRNQNWGEEYLFYYTVFCAVWMIFTLCLLG